MFINTTIIVTTTLNAFLYTSQLVFSPKYVTVNINTVHINHILYIEVIDNIDILYYINIIFEISLSIIIIKIHSDFFTHI